MKLFVDSSTNYLILAIWNNNKIISTYRNGKNDHSETLAHTLKDFLDSNNILPTSIKEVYVGRGPGSYTGVRISGTVCKVFAYLTKATFYSFSSLDMIASCYLKEGLNICPRIVAKRNHSYYNQILLLNNNIIYKVSDKFDCDDYINYHNSLIVTLDEQEINSIDVMVRNILKYHLYKEVNSFDYCPNYLRSSLS